MRYVLEILLVIILLIAMTGCGPISPVVDVNRALGWDAEQQYVWIGYKTLCTVNGEQYLGYWRKNNQANQYEMAASYLEYVGPIPNSREIRFKNPREESFFAFGIPNYKNYNALYSNQIPLEMAIPVSNVLYIK